ncbi:P-loop containing nucleoside triphosphate hydrolase protein [Mycena vulgaris]|nr:P-loop containing nucleoside triphosphate hydrolase protein [Mycena vulgaris]
MPPALLVVPTLSAARQPLTGPIYPSTRLPLPTRPPLASERLDTQLDAQWHWTFSPLQCPALNWFRRPTLTSIDHPQSFPIHSVVTRSALTRAPIQFSKAICRRMARPAVSSRISNADAAHAVGSFAAAVTGLASIRAYGCQDAFIKESLRRLDRYSRTARLSFDLTRWSSVRTEMLSNIFTSTLAIYLVYFQNYNAANTGFSLNAAVNFGSTVASWILCLNDFQLLSNSLERIEAYINIEQEPKSTKEGTPPAAWPSGGELVVENLSARYSPDGPKVLDDISFTVKSGERIGVVGGTGSGKSSLTLALLRAIVTEDHHHSIDELLSGKLRHNLDPFNQFSDPELTDALRVAGLFSLQGESADSNITLETVVAGGGNNLSVGQRQIIALTRTMLRRSKLLILDEATSAIDYATDAVIQSSLRKLGKGVTLITVAHRLQTILDADRIMVLDAGCIVEFDTPRKLLEVEDGVFRALLDESEDRDALYAMANA